MRQFLRELVFHVGELRGWEGGEVDCFVDGGRGVSFGVFGLGMEGGREGFTGLVLGGGGGW